MDFFDILFGNKKEPLNKDASSKQNQDDTNCSPEKAQNRVASVMDPVEQYVKESVTDLKKHMELDTKALEAEAIYLAAFLYMKDSYQIDFEIDYLSEGLLERIPSNNFQIADKVFSYMIKYGENYYGQEEKDYGVDGYKMNIQLCPDYGSYIKNYFIRAHHIGSGKDYLLFSSPRNCLWRNGVKSIDSPTQRDVYYKFEKGNFELMIPPYNPLVTGKIERKTETTIRCQSNDGKRTFIFHYKDTISPNNLEYIEMYRNDKGDMITYHKNS